MLSVISNCFVSPLTTLKIFRLEIIIFNNNIKLNKLVFAIDFGLHNKKYIKRFIFQTIWTIYNKRTHYGTLLANLSSWKFWSDSPVMVITGIAIIVARLFICAEWSFIAHCNAALTMGSTWFTMTQAVFR